MKVPAGKPLKPGDEQLLAGVYAVLCDRDRAIAELEKLIQTRSAMAFVFVDPQLDPLRTDTRFQQLPRRAGIPQK